MSEVTTAVWRLFDVARRDQYLGNPIESVALPLAVVVALRVSEAGSEPPERRGRRVRWSDLRGPRHLERVSRDEIWHSACHAVGLEQALASRPPELPEGELLRAIVDFVDAVPLRSAADVEDLAGALGHVVALATERSRYGEEYTTPPRLARLMVSLSRIRATDTVFDPCCGTGELLVTALRAQGKSVNEAGTAPQYFGVERLPSLQFITTVRLLLEGGRSRIEVGDALRADVAQRHQSAGYDCVLVHPPWGIRVDDPGHIELPVPTKSAEAKFVQLGLSALRSEGTAVFAIPKGFLFRDGAERRIRQQLTDEFGLSVVATIPQGPGRDTPLATAIVVARRTRPEHQTYFMAFKSMVAANEALDRGLGAFGALGRGLSDADVATPSHWIELHELFSARSVTTAEIIANDYTFEPSRYTEPALDDRLAELARHVNMAPLEEVATVVAGAALARAAMTEDARAGRPIIRVSDVDPRGPLVLGARFLASATAAKIRADQAPREGDVLLTIDGTIGKTHAVRTVVVSGRERDVNAAPQPIIAKGVVAVRPDTSKLDVRFLLGVLRSTAFQQRLLASARGSALLHVPLGVLRALQVPVPSLEIQARVVRRLAEQGGDAVEVLGLVLSGEDGDRLAELFREHRAFVRLADEGEPDAEEIERFAIEALEWLRRLRNEVAHPRADKQLRIAPEFHSWLLRVGSVPVSALRPSGRGEARFEALSASTALLTTAATALKSVPGLVARRALRLTERLSEWTKSAQDRLANDFELEARQVSRSTSVDRAVTEIEVVLRGQAVLRNVQVTAPPGWELRPQTPQLSLGLNDTVGATLSAARPLRVEFRRASGPENESTVLRILWEGTRFDDTVATGELRCDVAPAQPALPIFEAPVALGASPYITGDVVEDPEMFFGRTGVLEDIKTHIGGGTRVILLEGNRRTGKTSILRRLQARDFGLQEEWVVVECSFQGAAGDDKKDGVPTSDVFRLIVRDIGLAASKAGIAIPLPGMPPTTSVLDFKFAFLRALNGFFEGMDPYEALRLFIDLVVERISPKRLLLLFDEFDKLQVGIDNGITSPQVPENIRNLLQTRSSVKAIIAGSRRLKRLREEYWSALFGFGHRIGVDPLQEDEARQLVTRPVAGRLAFETAAVDLVVNLTAAQPFLIQSLCARIFEIAKRERQHRIQPGLVRDAAELMVRDNEHFQALWTYAETEQRRYLLCLCKDLEGSDTRVTADLLAERLDRAGITVRIDAVDDDLRFLLELEIVRLTNTDIGPKYGLAVPLMKMWMHASVDGEAQRRRAIQEVQARSST